MVSGLTYINIIVNIRQRIYAVKKKIDNDIYYTYKGSMKIMITIKLDPRMKKGIEKLADEQLVNMSTVIRQAVDKYLKEHNIDWRKNDTEEAGKEG